MRGTSRLADRLNGRLSGGTLALLSLVLAGCAGAPPPGTPAPATITRSAARKVIDSLVSAPQFDNAMWGVLVVHPSTGDTLYSRNAGKMFMPASNMKLVTMSVALAQLGRDYRWTTVYGARGVIRDSVLDGDLVVYGRGDPSVSNRMRGDAMAPLRDVADSLRARGIREIRGNIVAGGDAFPGSVIGYGWEWQDLEGAAEAVYDELYFNDGVARITVYGGATPGAPLRAVTTPSSGTPAVFLGGTTADPAMAQGARRPTVRITRVGLQDAFDVTGSLLPGDSAGATVTLREPSNAFLNALRSALIERGITLSAGTSPAEPPAVDTLFRMKSLGLDSVLKAMAKPSQNQLAEDVFKTIGLERGGAGVLDSSKKVIVTQLAAWGVGPSGTKIMDGSGVSRHSLLTPETILRILVAMKARPDFSVFYDALPIAGVDGTIGTRMKGTLAEGNMHAKTGTLNHASSLSGYVKTADGEDLLFVMFCNNFTTPANTVTGVQDAIGTTLARMRWRSK